MKTITLKRDASRYADGVVGATNEQYQLLLDKSEPSELVIVGADGKEVCKLPSSVYGNLVYNPVTKGVVAIHFTKAVEALKTLKANVKKKR